MISDAMKMLIVGASRVIGCLSVIVSVGSVTGCGAADPPPGDATDTPAGEVAFEVRVGDHTEDGRVLLEETGVRLWQGGHEQFIGFQDLPRVARSGADGYVLETGEPVEIRHDSATQMSVRVGETEATISFPGGVPSLYSAGSAGMSPALQPQSLEVVVDVVLFAGFLGAGACYAYAFNWCVLHGHYYGYQWCTPYDLSQSASGTVLYCTFGC